MVLVLVASIVIFVVPLRPWWPTHPVNGAKSEPRVEDTRVISSRSLEWGHADRNLSNADPRSLVRATIQTFVSTFLSLVRDSFGNESVANAEKIVCLHWWSLSCIAVLRNVSEILTIVRGYVNVSTFQFLLCYPAWIKYLDRLLIFESWRNWTMMQDTSNEWEM